MKKITWLDPEMEEVLINAEDVLSEVSVEEGDNLGDGGDIGENPDDNEDDFLE